VVVVVVAVVAAVVAAVVVVAVAVVGDAVTGGREGRECVDHGPGIFSAALTACKRSKASAPD
jgi:hypothetical protein